MSAPAWTVVATLLAGLASPSLGDTGPLREIVIETPGERTLTNQLVIGGVLGAGLAVGAAGLYWHLDSRSAANEVSAVLPTGESWSASHVDLVERADRSGTRATIAYSLGGAIVIGAVIAFIVTDPPTERTVIRAREIRPTTLQIRPTIIPTPEGALLGSRWRF